VDLGPSSMQALLTLEQALHDQGLSSFPTRRSSDLRPSAMDLRFSGEDEAFRGEVRDWLEANLTGDFAEARGLGLRRSRRRGWPPDRKSTRLNSSHLVSSYAVFCLKKKIKVAQRRTR